MIDTPDGSDSDFAWPRYDRDGAPLQAGDVVRVVGVPDLSGMTSECRAESEPVFRHLLGARKRIAGFDDHGHAELSFRLRTGPHAGWHSVWIEPHLLKKPTPRKRDTGGLVLRFVDGADPRLEPELLAFGSWLRRTCAFPVRFELRLVNRPTLTDDDGSPCFLRWWQDDDDRPVFAEIAVGSFARLLDEEGPDVAFPTVVAAMGRALWTYLRVTQDLPTPEDEADAWGDRLLDAYVTGSDPPQP